MPAAILGPLENVAVMGGGSAFPERQLSNGDVLRHIAPFTWPGRTRTHDEIEFMAAGLTTSMGVESRAWTHLVGTPLDHATEQTGLDLAVEASRAALRDAGVSGGDLSLVLAATSTPHRMTSTLSAALGAALGAHAACMDTRSGCAGALFALATAALYVNAGCGPVLIVGAETFSKVVPRESKVAAMSLGDGAGALVVGARAGATLRSAFLETDGELARLITTDGALPPTESEITRGGYLLRGSPEELMETVPSKYEAAIAGALTRAGVEIDAIDLFLPHQTSIPLISEVARRIGAPPARTFVNVGRHSNIGSAGWIVAFVEARAAGRVPRGANVLLAAVGGGMSWASAVLTC